MVRIKNKFNYYRYKVLIGLGNKITHLGFSVKDKAISYLFKEELI